MSEPPRPEPGTASSNGAGEPVPCAPPAEGRSGGGIADGRERSLDPRAVAAARLSGAIAATVIAALSAVGLLVSTLTAQRSTAAVLALLVGWLLLNGAFAGQATFWPALRQRYTSYRVDARGIRIRRGVIWRSEVTVPRSRIQHTDVSRGPIERGFGLATLTLHTAGTEHATISLGGLSADVAGEIRNFLIEVGEDDAV